MSDSSQGAKRFPGSSYHPVHHHRARYDGARLHRVDRPPTRRRAWAGVPLLLAEGLKAHGHTLIWTCGFPSQGEPQGMELQGQVGTPSVTPLKTLTGGPPRRLCLLRAGLQRPASTPKGCELEPRGWACISLTTDEGQRPLTDISEEMTIQLLCACLNEAAFSAQISECFFHVFFDLSMVKYFLLVMKSKKMKILANFMFSHVREPRSPFSQDAVWGAQQHQGAGTWGAPKPYPAVLEPPTPPATATEERGWPRRVTGTRVQPLGQQVRPRCGSEAAGVLGSREVEKLPAIHTAMRAQVDMGAAARRGQSPARGGCAGSRRGGAAGAEGAWAVSARAPGATAATRPRSVRRTRLPPGLPGPPGTHSLSGLASGRRP